MTTKASAKGAMKALRQFEYAQPLQVCEVPIPTPASGIAVVCVLAAPILSSVRDIYNGKRAYPYLLPLTTGTGAFGPVYASDPLSKIMHWNSSLKGKWIYEREDVQSLIHAVGLGVLRFGKAVGVMIM